jgi:hypothetical protein
MADWIRTKEPADQVKITVGAFSSQDKSNQNTNLITKYAKLRFVGTNHSRFNKEVEKFLIRNSFLLWTKLTDD